MEYKEIILKTTQPFLNPNLLIINCKCGDEIRSFERYVTCHIAIKNYKKIRDEFEELGDALILAKWLCDSHGISYYDWDILKIDSIELGNVEYIDMYNPLCPSDLLNGDMYTIRYIDITDCSKVTTQLLLSTYHKIKLVKSYYVNRFTKYDDICEELYLNSKKFKDYIFVKTKD